MKLSEHFSLYEFLRTSKGLPAIPTIVNIRNMKNLCRYVLEPVRIRLNSPIIISSGLRSYSVNKIVRGSSTSQHLTGQAADLTCCDNKSLFCIIKKYCIFDQLIWEGGNKKSPAWVHVSFSLGNNRNQILYNYDSK